MMTRCQKTLPEAQRTQGIDFITWVNLSARTVQDWFQWHYLNCHQMAPHALVQNLVTRWHHLHQFQIWSPDGATCIDSKHLHFFFQIWPPNSSACISFKFCHQMALLWLEIWPPGWLDESHALPHCLGLPNRHYQLVLAWYLHQPESHQLSLQQPLWLTHNWTHRSDPRDTWVR